MYLYNTLTLCFRNDNNYYNNAMHLKYYNYTRVYIRYFI